MNRRKKGILVAFGIGLVLLFISRFFIEVSFLPDKVLKVMRIVAYGAFLYGGWRGKCWEKSDGKKVSGLIILLALGLFYVLVSKQFAFLELFLVCFAASGMKFFEVVRMDFWVRTILTIVLLGVWAFGESTYGGIVRDGGVTVRLAYGYSHPNIFSMNLAMMVFDFFYLLRKEKIKASYYWLPIFLCTFILFSADSRTVVVVVSLFMLMNVMTEIFGRKFCSKKIVWIYKIALAAIMICSVICTFGYSERIGTFMKLDGALSGRLDLQAYHLSKSGMGIMGREIAEKEPPLDNSAVRVIITFGVVGVIFYLIYYSLLMEKAVRERDEMMVKILISLVVLAIFEMHPLFVYNNIFLVYLFAL